MTEQQTTVPVGQRGAHSLVSLKADVDTRSGKLSDVLRALCYAGFGAILLIGGIKAENFGKAAGALNNSLKIAAAILALAMIFDAAQYLVGMLHLRSQFRARGTLVRNGELGPEDLATIETGPAKLTWTMFWLKVSSVTIAWAILLYNLASTL